MDLTLSQQSDFGKKEDSPYEQAKGVSQLKQSQGFLRRRSVVQYRGLVWSNTNRPGADIGKAFRAHKIAIRQIQSWYGFAGVAREKLEVAASEEANEEQVRNSLGLADKGSQRVVAAPSCTQKTAKSLRIALPTECSSRSGKQTEQECSFPNSPTFPELQRASLPRRIPNCGSKRGSWSQCTLLCCNGSSPCSSRSHIRVRCLGPLSKLSQTAGTRPM